VSGNEGRTRRRLREMLESLGFTDVELWPQKGAWRTDKRLDVYSFEGSALLPPDSNGRRHNVAVCSWSTMTEIVKSRGVIVDHDDLNSIQLHPSPNGVSRIEGAP
jgi:hypothetical protein